MSSTETVSVSVAENTVADTSMRIGFAEADIQPMPVTTMVNDPEQLDMKTRDLLTAKIKRENSAVMASLRTGLEHARNAGQLSDRSPPAHVVLQRDVDRLHSAGVRFDDAHLASVSANCRQME